MKLQEEANIAGPLSSPANKRTDGRLFAAAERQRLIRFYSSVPEMGLYRCMCNETGVLPLGPVTTVQVIDAVVEPIAT